MKDVIAPEYASICSITTNEEDVTLEVNENENDITLDGYLLQVQVSTVSAENSETQALSGISTLSNVSSHLNEPVAEPSKKNQQNDQCWKKRTSNENCKGTPDSIRDMSS